MWGSKKPEAPQAPKPEPRIVQANQPINAPQAIPNKGEAAHRSVARSDSVLAWLGPSLQVKGRNLWLRRSMYRRSGRGKHPVGRTRMSPRARWWLAVTSKGPRPHDWRLAWPLAIESTQTMEPTYCFFCETT